jgi:hypothetical protein
MMLLVALLELKMTESRNAFLKKYELANTNWFKTLFRPSITQKSLISFLVVVKQHLCFFGFYSDPGWTLADQVNQLTSNIKNTFFINDNCATTQASVRDQSAPGSYDSLKMV